MKEKHVIAALLGALALVGVTACSNGPRQDYTGQQSATALVNQGITQGQEGDKAAAQASFRRALDLDPTNKYAWFNLGYLAQMSGDSTAAIANYDKALGADPLYVPANYNKAIALEATHPDQSVALYRNVLTINPAAAAAMFRLAGLLDKQGNKPEAKNMYAAALKADPSLKGATPAEYGGTLVEPRK